ncbi:MAG: hypothetical protein MUF62_06105 [Chitinophagaceae bacterium]|jgi:hypothetical protein|nr:hypothetical protein [Chitinophagaceae bacterium]
MLLTNNAAPAQPTLQLVQRTPLPYFKNLTALEYHDKTVMAIGNDATRIMLLSRQHKMLDTLQLFDYKNKPDKSPPAGGIQATAVVTLENKSVLLIMGSGQPRADKSDIWLFPLQTRHFSEVYIPSFAIPDFFKRMQKAGVKEINIEGAAAIGKRMVLANSATARSKDNFLVVTEFDFWTNSLQVGLHLSKLDLDDPSMTVSGLEYDKQQDVLLFSATATDNSNATAGSQPKIGVILSASKRMNERSIRPDFLFSVATVVPEAGNQALRSICLEDDQAEKGSSMLHLCATDSGGKCYIYKLSIKWN